jgi:hypothetical protein
MDVSGFQAFMKGQEEAFKAILPNCATIDPYELHAELSKATGKMERALHNMYPRNKPGSFSNSSTPVKLSAGLSTPSRAVSTPSKPTGASGVANSARNSSNSLDRTPSKTTSSATRTLHQRNRDSSATPTPIKMSQYNNNLPLIVSGAPLQFDSPPRRASSVSATASIGRGAPNSLRRTSSSTSSPNKPLASTTNTPTRQKESANTKLSPTPASRRVSQASRNIVKRGGASATFSRYIKDPIHQIGEKHYISDSSSQAASDHEISDEPETLAVPKQRRLSKPGSQLFGRKETPVRKRSRNDDERLGKGVFTPMAVATKKPGLSAGELNMAFLEGERKKSLSLSGGESLSPERRLGNQKVLEVEDDDTIVVEC